MTRLEAVRVAGLGEQRLGLGRVVAVVDLARLAAGQVLRVDLVQRDRLAALQLDQLVAVDRPAQRLPHLDVVERLLGLVHEQVGRGDERLRVHVGLPLRVVGDPRHVGRRDVVAEDVHFAALQLEQGVGRREVEGEVHAVQVHLVGVPVVGVLEQRDLAPGRPLGHVERAGAERVPVHLLAPLGDPFLGHHVAELHAQRVQEAEVGRGELELDRLRVDDLDAADRLRLAVHGVGRADDAFVEVGGRAARLGHHALEAVLDVVGRDGAVHRRRELRVGPQLDGVRRAVGRDLRHVDGEVGDELRARGARLGRVAVEGVEDRVLDGPPGDVPADRRVERDRLALEGDADGAAGLRRGAGGRCAPVASPRRRRRSRRRRPPRPAAERGRAGRERAMREARMRGRPPM